MLIDSDTRDRIEQTLQVVADSVALQFIGQPSGGMNSDAMGSPGYVQTPSNSLDQAFVAGIAASAVGVDQMKDMSDQALQDWVMNNPGLDDSEAAILKQLQDSASTWLDGAAGDWTQSIQEAISSANADWVAKVTTGSFTEEELSSYRDEALADLVSEIRDATDSYMGNIDRTLQTEMNTFFQQGQTSSAKGDSYVYKIPRAAACEYCLSIHLEKDGSPSVYKLSDVAGNSNIGLKPRDWDFVIGATHPYCYCVLYQTDDPNTAPGANKGLAKAYEESMKKMASYRERMLTPMCECQSEPELICEALQKDTPGGQLEPFQLKFITGLKKIYGDRLPT